MWVAAVMHSVWSMMRACNFGQHHRGISTLVLFISCVFAHVHIWILHHFFCSYTQHVGQMVASIRQYRFHVSLMLLLGLWHRCNCLVEKQSAVGSLANALLCSYGVICTPRPLRAFQSQAKTKLILKFTDWRLKILSCYTCIAVLALSF